MFLNLIKLSKEFPRFLVYLRPDFKRLDFIKNEKWSFFQSKKHLV